MNDSIKEITIIIAYKLALQEKAVKIWIKSNRYNLLQLNTIAKQISCNEIYIPTLVDSIIYDKKYQISVY